MDSVIFGQWELWNAIACHPWCTKRSNDFPESMAEWLTNILIYRVSFFWNTGWVACTRQQSWGREYSFRTQQLCECLYEWFWSLQICSQSCANGKRAVRYIFPSIIYWPSYQSMLRVLLSSSGIHYAHLAIQDTSHGLLLHGDHWDKLIQASTKPYTIIWSSDNIQWGVQCSRGGCWVAVPFARL